jgi:hypothetical protein
MNSRPEARTVAPGAALPVPSIAEWQARQAEVMARQDRIRASLLEQVAANDRTREAQASAAFDRLEAAASEMGRQVDEAQRLTAADVALIVVAGAVAVAGLVNTILNWWPHVAP